MKTERAGALLFAIITAFVLTLVVSTIVILTTNQFRIIDNEVDRISAFYYDQAGIEFAIYNLYSNTAGWTPSVDNDGNGLFDVSQPVTIGGRNINIFIEALPPGGISTYTITASINY